MFGLLSSPLQSFEGNTVCIVSHDRSNSAWLGLSLLWTRRSLWSRQTQASLASRGHVLDAHLRRKAFFGQATVPLSVPTLQTNRRRSHNNCYHSALFCMDNQLRNSLAPHTCMYCRNVSGITHAGSLAPHMVSDLASVHTLVLPILLRLFIAVPSDEAHLPSLNSLHWSETTMCVSLKKRQVCTFA